MRFINLDKEITNLLTNNENKEDFAFHCGISLKELEEFIKLEQITQKIPLPDIESALIIQFELCISNDFKLTRCEENELT